MARTAKQPPPLPPRELHAATVRELSTAISGAPGAGTLLTMLLAVPSFGILPALVWPIGWRGYVATERRQLFCLARWVRMNSRDPRAKTLVGRAATMRARPILSALTFLCSIAVLVLFFLAFGRTTGVSALLDSTYHFAPAADVDPRTAWLAGTDTQRQVFSLWVGLISVAAMSHWLQVQLHARDVRKYLDVFNAIAVDEGIAPVQLRPIGVGLRPFWMLAATVMIVYSAPWAIAVALAGAVQRRYTHHSAQDYRTHLAERARDMLARRRPMPMMVMPISRVRCQTVGCQIPLPTGARFCPRCGVRSVPKLDRVA